MVDAFIFAMSSVMLSSLSNRCLIEIRMHLSEICVNHVPDFLDGSFKVNFWDIQFPGISFGFLYDMAGIRAAYFIFEYVFLVRMRLEKC